MTSHDKKVDTVKNVPKHKFFETVKEQVKKLTISSIIEDYTEVKQSNYSEKDAKCPFHNDESFGSFKINDDKGIYKCFSCDNVYGDGIQFVKSLEEISFKEAVMKIAYQHGIISKSQHEDYFGGELKETSYKPVVVKERKRQTDEIVEKGTNELLDSVFSVFAETASLEEKHVNYLKGRGLSDEDIKAGGYFTFPEATQKFLRDFYVNLAEKGVFSQELKNIPGFATAKHLKEERNGEVRYLYTFQSKKGIGIPVKNALGQIVGIQIRNDVVTGKELRYIWFSSKFAEKKNVYIHGTTAGSPNHISYPERIIYPGVVFITEGIFKSQEVAKHFGATCISLQGVASYKDIGVELKAIEEKQGKIKNIVILFDADMSSNVSVYRHSKNLHLTVKEAIPYTNVHISMWNESDGKGIDDLIQEGKEDTLRKMDMTKFETLYDDLIEELEKKHKEKIVKIEKTIIKKAFMTTIFPTFYVNNPI